MQLSLFDDAGGVDLKHASFSGDVVPHETSVAVIPTPITSLKYFNILTSRFLY
jgi:hypothetical protein